MLFPILDLDFKAVSVTKKGEWMNNKFSFPFNFSPGTAATQGSFLCIMNISFLPQLFFRLLSMTGRWISWCMFCEININHAKSYDLVPH